MGKVLDPFKLRHYTDAGRGFWYTEKCRKEGERELEREIESKRERVREQRNERERERRRRKQ